MQSVCSASHHSAEPSMLVCFGRLQWVKKKGFLKATYHPLGGKGTPSLMPVLRQEFPNSLSHWNSWRHFLWCRWLPAPWPGKVFPLGRCEIPLLEGSPGPRGQALEGYVKQQQFAIWYSAWRAGPLSTCSQKGSCPRQEGVRPESGFRKSEQRDPHPFEANRNLPSDLMGPRIWL